MWQIFSSLAFIRKSGADVVILGVDSPYVAVMVSPLALTMIETADGLTATPRTSCPDPWCFDSVLTLC